MKSHSLNDAKDGLVIAKSVEASKCDPDKLGLFKETIADIFFNNKTNYSDATDIYIEYAKNKSNEVLYGHANAKLAYMFLSGTYLNVDEPKAVQLYRDAAEAGDPDGLYFIGSAAYNGMFGVTKKPEAGFNILKLVADSGEKTLAMKAVGEAYLSGIGTIKNTTNSLKYFNMAAMRGDIESQKKLGILYSTIDDDNRNQPLGYAWLLIYQSHGYDEDMYKFTNEQEKLITKQDKSKGMKLTNEISKKIHSIQ